jgi:hypothetical protein
MILIGNNLENSKSLELMMDNINRDPLMIFLIFLIFGIIFIIAVLNAIGLAHKALFVFLSAVNIQFIISVERDITIYQDISTT